jgi:hypothetical protein
LPDDSEPEGTAGDTEAFSVAKSRDSVAHHPHKSWDDVAIPGVESAVRTSARARLVEGDALWMRGVDHRLVRDIARERQGRQRS